MGVFLSENDASYAHAGKALSDQVVYGEEGLPSMASSSNDRGRQAIYVGSWIRITEQFDVC